MSDTNIGLDRLDGIAHGLRDILLALARSADVNTTDFLKRLEVARNEAGRGAKEIAAARQHTLDSFISSLQKDA